MNTGALWPANSEDRRDTGERLGLSLITLLIIETGTSPWWLYNFAMWAWDTNFWGLTSITFVILVMTILGGVWGAISEPGEELSKFRLGFMYAAMCANLTAAMFVAVNLLSRT